MFCKFVYSSLIAHEMIVSLNTEIEISIKKIKYVTISKQLAVKDHKLEQMMEVK